MSVKHGTIFTGDNLAILRGMEDDFVDLIYLDPPFNSNRNYSAPIGSKAAGAEFKDTWTLDDVDVAWHGEIAESQPALYDVIKATDLAHGRGMAAYLIYMSVRLLEMKRVLKETGSIYLHCDPTASHYLKLAMDCVFGKGNFRNEIVWGYPASPSSTKRDFPRKHDTILRYALGDYCFNADEVRIPYADSSNQRIRYSANKSTVMKGELIKLHERGKIPPTVWTDITQTYRHRKEHLGYPTQKPLALLDRIIRASSSEGDLVLDPFCGCATACVAAQRACRKWIGIDISEKAYSLINARLMKEDDLVSPVKVIHRTDIPQRKGSRSAGIRHTLYGEQEGVCNGCKVHFPFRNMTVDHIVPTAKGGANADENLQLLCQACNSQKGIGTMEELRVKLKKWGGVMRLWWKAVCAATFSCTALEALA